MRFDKRTEKHMKKTHLNKTRKESSQKPIAYLSGLCPVDTDLLRQTLPCSLLERELFCYTVRHDGQDIPFDPDSRSILSPVTEWKRISFPKSVSKLEEGRADGLGIILKEGDGLCVVTLKSDACFQPSGCSAEVAATISNLNSYTLFGLGGGTITVLCEAVKPKAFLDNGVLPDGTDVIVLDHDCFVSLSGMPFREEQDVFSRQDEIVTFCEDYVDLRCPIVGVDGALKSIVPSVFVYSDRREEFLAEWNRRVARQKRLRTRMLPPEFVASMEMFAHLMGVDE
jgi:hypothetical protein